MAIARAALPLWVLVLVALAPVAAAVHLWSPEALESVAQEDGVVEYAQALAFFTGGVLFLWRAARRRFRDGWSLVLGAGLLLVAGEEISWGQRLFGIDPPDAIGSNNVQGELNLHNIEGLHQNVRALGIAVIVALFIAVPVLRSASSRFRRLEGRLGLPLVPLSVVPLALAALGFMFVPRLVGDVVFELDEVGELYVALTALAYAVGAFGVRVSVPAVLPSVPKDEVPAVAG